MADVNSIVVEQIDSEDVTRFKISNFDSSDEEL